MWILPYLVSLPITPSLHRSFLQFHCMSAQCNQHSSVTFCLLNHMYVLISSTLSNKFSRQIHWHISLHWMSEWSKRFSWIYFYTKYLHPLTCECNDQHIVKFVSIALHGLSVSPLMYRLNASCDCTKRVSCSCAYHDLAEFVTLMISVTKLCVVCMH